MKISIITVNLNNYAGLEKTISSVFDQDYDNIEFIVIDGASQDSSVDLLKKYSEKFSYWVSETDKGIYHAMNKGLAKASGDYCLFLNSGDYLVNENTISAVFSSNFSEDILYGDRIEVLENSVLKEYVFPDKIRFSFFFDNTIGHQSSFIRRDLFKKVGNYNENLKYAADWLFFLHAIFKAECSYRHLNQFICYYDRSGISSQEKNREKMITERLQLLRANFPFFVEDYIDHKKLKARLKHIQDKSIEFKVKRTLLTLYRKVFQK